MLFLAGFSTFLRFLGIFQVLFGCIVVALVAGDFGTSLLNFKILGRFVFFLLDLFDLIGVSNLGRLHDFLEKADAIFTIFNQCEVQGHFSVDLFRMKMVKAYIVQRNNLLCLAKPTDRLARRHQDFLVVVSRTSEGLDDVQVSEVADYLAGLVGLQSDPEGRLVVHKLNTAIYPFVQFNRRLLRVGRSVVARKVLFA